MSRIPAFRRPPFSSTVRAFTVIEMVVVIAVVAILSSIAVVSYVGMIADARDTSRKTDAGDLKIQLRGMKQRNGAYPLPNAPFSITNSGVVIVRQGDTDSVSTDGGGVLRTDPRTGNPYRYSTVANRQSFQIAATLEATGEKLRAYVDGDYSPLAPDIVPSLVLAMSGTSDVEIRDGVGSGSENRKKFVVNASTLNLAYDLFGDPMATAPDFASILEESGVRIPRTSSYYDCRSVYEAGKSVGPGTYYMLDFDGSVTSTGCVMNPPQY